MRYSVYVPIALAGCLAFGTAAAQRGGGSEAESLRDEVARLQDAVSRLERIAGRLSAGGQVTLPVDPEGWREIGNWAVLSPGMTKLEVRALLGPPAYVSSRYGASQTQWDYPNGRSVRFSQQTGLMTWASS